MKNTVIILVAALLAILATVYFLLPSDEKEIRRNLDLLAEHCSTTSVEAAMDPQQRQAAIMDIQNQMAPALNRQFAQQGIGEEAKAIKAGAFGGDRRFVYEGERQAALGANAYNLASQELDRRAAQGISGLQAQQAIAAAQMGAGEARRQLEQQALDVGYQNYLDERNFPLSWRGLMFW